MNNQEDTNQANQPSLGDDIREQIIAQEQQPEIEGAEPQNSQPQEEEEAWWQKYVREEPEVTNAIVEPAEPEAESLITDTVPPVPDFTVPDPSFPEPPEPETVIQTSLTENSPAYDFPEDRKIPPGDPGDEKKTKPEIPLLNVELPPLPPPPENEEVTDSLPPVPIPSTILEKLPPTPPPPKIEVVSAALPPPPVRAQPDREMALPNGTKPISIPSGKPLSEGSKGRGDSLAKRGVKQITPPSKSVRKLWPFAVGATVVIFAIFFVPFIFVPDIVVEGKVEEEEMALLSDYSGKVETIFVQKWEKIQAGEPLIKLQSDELEEELEGLITKLKMRYEGFFQEYQDEIAKLNRIIVTAEIDYKALVSENQAMDRQIKNLNTYLTRDGLDDESKPVKKEGIAERQSVLSADYAKNQSKITKLSGEIATAESDIRQLMGKVRDLQEKEFLDMADLEEENKYELLLGKSDHMVLKAPVTGSVSELKFKEGQSIVKGDTILRIVSDPDRIKIMIPEDRIKEHSVGDFVWVKEGSKKAGFLRVPIIVMSPKINSEDASLESGRSVFLSYPTESALLPGQKVTVHLNNPAETGLQSVHRKISRKFEYAKRRE